MTDPATGQRSHFQALKVPFDLKGVAAGMLAWVVFKLARRAVGEDFRFRERLAGLLEPYSVPWDLSKDMAWAHLLVALGVATFFGVACCRIAGMRIARDEGVDLTDALAFSVKNLPATLGAYLFAAFAAAFFFGCNALAGLVAGIPSAGPFLSVLLLPLVFLSSLLLFLIAFGALLGLPLTLSSLAVERNGALDAVSRAFSYVFGRPALFFFYAFTVLFIALVLERCTAFLDWLWVWSFSKGIPAGDGWGAIDAVLGEAWSQALQLRPPEFVGSLIPLRAAPGAAAKFGGWVVWGAALLFHAALMGWIVYYLFGGATAAYFALRRDVDGTEDEEIWVEGEDRDAFGEPERPEPASAAGAAAAGKPEAAPEKPPQ